MIDDIATEAALSRNLGSPTAPGEAVESELDRLIERRSRQKDPDEESELWRESARAYTARRRDEMRAAWCEYHTERAASLRRNLVALAEGHEAAAKLLDVQQEGSA